ncbi:hypothetical protein RB195_024670 [Necator americanus]|uniref:Uncharacterized protein n=1 Tax=Necator americanus TaxID=51031 RepID=A0ABR1EP49_NECAM
MKLQHVVKLASRPRAGIRVNGQPIKLVDEFCYLGYTLKNNGYYEKDIQQRCAKATSAFNSFNEMPVVDPHHQRSQAASPPIRNSPHHDVRIGYLWPIVCHNEELYAEIDI